MTTSPTDEQLMIGIATVAMTTSFIIGCLGLSVGFLQQTFLRNEGAPNPWKYYPFLRRQWQKKLSAFMPEVARDGREMVLDLKLNTSLAFAIGALGWGTIAGWLLLMNLAWQFEKLRNLSGFTLSLVYGLIFGFALAALVLWTQVVSSRRRQLLKAALVLTEKARDYGPTTTAATKRVLAASGRNFLAACSRLGIAAESRHITSVSHYLSDEGRRNYRNVNKLLVEETTHLVREVYQGEHSMTMQMSRRFALPQPNTLLKIFVWIASIATAPVLARLLSNWSPFL